MASFNTALGVLPSPKTQLFGGNAGGGVGGAAPKQPSPFQQFQQKPQQQQPQQVGGAPTFAQLQQQGQARPAPQQVQPQQAPAQPPMLTALSQQLAQPAAPAQATFSPQQVQQAQTRLRDLQETGLANIRQAASAWSPEARGFVSNYFSSGIEGAGTGAGGAGGMSLGTMGYGWDANQLPYVEYTPMGGSMQRISQNLPQEVANVLAYAQEQEALQASQAPPPAPPPEAQALPVAAMAAAQAPEAAPAGVAPGQPIGPMGAFGGSAQAQELRARLAQQLDLLGRGPAEIEGQSYEALRKSKLADLEAQFGAQRSQLEEELARRGLSASTIGAGRYGDVAGQQARALTSLEADLLRQQADAEARNRQMYLSGMAELAGISGTQDLAQFEANLRSRQVESDISFRAKELQQEAALRGRELDLQSARDIATAESQKGQLALGYAEMGSRERMSAAEIASREQMQQTGFAFEAGQSALERQLREKMQTTELTAAEKRQLLGIEADKAAAKQRQEFEAGQAVLERQLREKMQTTELSAAEKRQLAEIEANKAEAERRRTFEADQQKKTQDWQAEQSKLDRDLRSLLSKQELDAAQARFEKTYALDLDRFGFEKGQASNQFLSQLATVLAPMDPKKRDEFLRTIGIKLPGTPAGSTGGTTSGGPFGSDFGI